MIYSNGVFHKEVHSVNVSSLKASNKLNIALLGENIHDLRRKWELLIFLIPLFITTLFWLFKPADRPLNSTFFATLLNILVAGVIILFIYGFSHQAYGASTYIHSLK
ncbi:hypothetical protein [Falsibacillus albus]|uniref:Uncharacterized protein n=1 Tax=Falsibacillus albus TaxID=2478915 RepID=A0A3L7JU17_9BACI|nr:hypothetical protein [Falsibacillus albus]RLQ94338.1 hypothetical protein D9X91_14900 [Falsibacillus albus]